MTTLSSVSGSATTLVSAVTTAAVISAGNTGGAIATDETLSGCCITAACTSGAGAAGTLSAIACWSWSYFGPRRYRANRSLTTWPVLRKTSTA